MEKNFGIDKENLDKNNAGNFTAEEIEFARHLAGDKKLNEDDFGFAEKEREEKEVAALREKFKEMAENTPEEDKKHLREELFQEEAEKLEKKERAQIEKETASFDNAEEKKQYLVLRNCGLVRSTKEFADTAKLFKPGTFFSNIEVMIKFVKNREQLHEFLETEYGKVSGKNILRDIEPYRFEHLVNYFKIDTLLKFKEFTENENNFAILFRGKEENIEFATSVFNKEQFQVFLNERRAVLFIEHGNSEVLKDYLNFNQIKTPEKIQALFGDEKLDNVLFSLAQPENSKYIFSNFIKKQEDIDRAFKEDGSIEELLQKVSLKNLEHVVDLYQIKTLEDLEDLYSEITVRINLDNANLENLVCVTRFSKNAKEFKNFCDEHRIGYILQKAKPENFREITNLCRDAEQFGVFEKETKNISYILEQSRPENLKSVIRHCRIKELGEEGKLAKELNAGRDNYLEVILRWAENKNLEDVFNFFQIESLDNFKDLYRQKEFDDVLRSKPENFHYLVKNNIISKNNFFRISFDSIDCLNALVSLSENKKEDIDFLKKLINQYPNSTDNTLSVLEDYNSNIDIDFARDTKDIFDILDRVGNITPVIFNKFRNLSPEERGKFAEDVKKVKREMFKNKPINMDENKDEVAELIYLSYKPIDMTYQQTKDFLAQIEDKTEDLKDYKFPENGYDISISNPTDKVLKKEKNLNFEKIDNIDSIIKNSVQYNLLEEKKEERGKEIFMILNKIAKAAPSLKNQETSRLLSIIKSESIYNFTKRHENISKENINDIYGYLSEAKEILGVIFKDNFRQNLKDFLEKDPENSERIKETLAKGKQSFIKALGKDFKDSIIVKDEYWNQLNIEKMAELLSIFTDEKIIGNLRKDANKELNKIGDKKTEDQKTSRKQKEEVKLKAYISKNVGSFFAKASAGICTSEDIALFNRKDHFHINTAEDQGNENELLRGNTQAYIIDDNGGKSLLLRGINPNSDFMYEINVGSYCDKIIETAKRFKEENNLKEVYLCEQLELWHALTNRPQVYEYLKAKYLKEENKKDFVFNITDNKKISKIYKV